jgi:DNA repair protein RadC
MHTDTMTLRELTLRYSAKKSRDGQPIIIGKTITRPKDAVPALMAILQDEPNEVFAILCLTRVRDRLSRSVAAPDATLVEPRGVFTAALLAHAAVIVAVHVPSAIRRRHAMTPKSLSDLPRLEGSSVSSS